MMMCYAGAVAYGYAPFNQLSEQEAMEIMKCALQVI